MTFSVPGFRERSHCGAELPALTASGSTPLIDSDPVRAVWHARCLRLSGQLHGLAELATVVDDVYVAAGMAGTHNRSTLGGGPEAVMLTQINRYDALGVVEYSSAGLGAGLRGERRPRGQVSPLRPQVDVLGAACGLVGRESELGVLVRWLGGLRERGAGLVVRGGAGVGKLSRVRVLGRAVESVLKENLRHGKTPVDSG